MNCCLQNILYINLHILYIIHIKTRSKIQELQESNKYIKSYQQNKFELLEKYYFKIPNFFVCQFAAYKHWASQITHAQIACIPKLVYKVLLNISQNHSSKECLNYF